MRYFHWKVTVAVLTAVAVTAGSGRIARVARAAGPGDGYYGVNQSADEYQLLRQRLDRYEQELAALRGQVSYAGQDGRVPATGASYAADANAAAAEDPACKKVDIITKPTHKFRGRIFFDHLMYDKDIGGFANETGFDTARIGVEGNAYENVIYKFEVEFEGTETDYKDVYMGLTDLAYLGDVLIGHFKQPMGLEELTSSRFDTFMEQSIATSAFVPSRKMGTAMYTNPGDNENVLFALGVYRDDHDDSPTGRGTFPQSNGDASVALRGVWLPYYDEPSEGRYFLHLGGSYNYRNVAEEIEVGTNQELGPNSGFLEVVTAGDVINQYGLELGWQNGPLNITAEYYGAHADEADFHGVYVEGSYFLTGEHRGYKRGRDMYYDRVKPFTPFFWVRTAEGHCKGWGAWQVAARYSRADLFDGDVVDQEDAGEQDNYTLGVNWYLNPYSRFMFNYVHNDVDRPNSTSGDVDFYGLRFQVDW